MNLELEPLSEAIGANVHGLDLRRPLDAEGRAALRRALDEHLALFVRDQLLTQEEMLAFGVSVGPLELHAFAPTDVAHPELVVLEESDPADKGADAWHTDASFTRVPPGIGILRAEVLPSVGGDTCFASAIAAFEALSPPLQRMLDKLRGVHDITPPLSLAIANGNFDGNLHEMQKRWPPVTHPVVIRHPRSGRKALFVNRNYTTRLEGLPPAESEGLLAFLLEHFRSPEIQCRFRWEPGSVAIWDNHFVQHFAVPDYHERRVMWRLSVAGDPIAA
ncbi:MAG: TauD/TfdA family dioxygenase [Deltaproteobacteria bacterium]|jgi:taurine dioxygenase|nr:TauD/TfdA family dioxygenase [Deltaproteobacteria bacterium]MBW2499800.1 TauD/TfdA family dioxygenase [Deltaproteobacteria bacterium]